MSGFIFWSEVTKCIHPTVNSNFVCVLRAKSIQEREREWSKELEIVLTVLTQDQIKKEKDSHENDIG